jgi:hypothetical protein
MVIIALLVALPFAVVVVGACVALDIFQPKTRLGAVICYVVPAVAFLSGVVAVGGTRGGYLFPLFWPLVLRGLGPVCIGIFGAVFPVAACRKKQLRSMREKVATPTI